MPEYNPVHGEIVRVRGWDDMLKEGRLRGGDICFEDDADVADFTKSMCAFCGMCLEVANIDEDEDVTLKAAPESKLSPELSQLLSRKSFSPRMLEPVTLAAESGNTELSALVQREKALQDEMKGVAQALKDARTAARAKILAEVAERKKAELAKRYEGFPPSVIGIVEYMTSKPRAFGCHREDVLHVISALTGVEVEQLKKATQAQ